MTTRQPHAAPPDGGDQGPPEHEMVQAMTSPHADGPKFDSVDQLARGSSIRGWLLGILILALIVGVAYWQGAAATP